MKKICIALIAIIVGLSSCKHEIYLPDLIDPNPDSTGTGANGSICFETDILPIFASNCAKSGCHNASSAEDGYVLDSYQNIIKKGVTPGRASNSKIYKVLLETGDKRMPQLPNPRLDVSQIERIAQWINEGAKNTTSCSTIICDDTKFAFSANVQPIFKTYCTGCHNTASASLNGNVDLSNYAGVQKALSRIPAVIQWKPGFPQMPQGSSKLSDCNIKVILTWINAGAPQN